MTTHISSKAFFVGTSVIILGALGFSLSGCAPLVVGGGAATAAVASSTTEERGVTGFWDDSKIKTQILYHYTREANALTHQVEVVVRQGRVLITGSITQPQLKVDAVRLAWKVPGVREVIDETTLENKETMASYTNDIWVTTKVKSVLLLEKNVSSANYNVQTIDGVVYVMGITPNTQELNKVIDVTRRVNGVKEVVNFIQVGKQTPPSPNKK
jgi:osmotically-inducible protein OsmY